jgi:hypothetical protein
MFLPVNMVLNAGGYAEDIIPYNWYSIDNHWFG